MALYHNMRMDDDDIADYFFSAEFFPRQLMGQFLFTLLEPEYKAKNGQLRELKKGDKLYSFFDPEFLEHFGRVFGHGRGCGVALGHADLTAVIVHGLERYWAMSAALGHTCSIHNKELNTITMLFQMVEGSLPNMAFIKALDAEQRDEFKKLVAKKGHEALSSPLMKPVFDLVTHDHCIEMDASCCANRESILEISADLLHYKLRHLAQPLPLITAHYFDGKNSIEVDGRGYSIRDADSWL